MLINHLKIAWRSMFRNRINSIINVAGLSIGIACVIMIALFVQDEQKFDRFFPHSDRVYQVDLDLSMGGQSAYTSNSSPTVGPALKRNVPEIEAYTRYYVMGREVISTDAQTPAPKRFTETRFLSVDSNFLQVFDFPMKEGDANTCFQQPHSIVLTETTAKKYFGNEDAVGRKLVLDEYSEPFAVTAVLKDVPKQSSIQFDLLIPVAACPMVKRFSWSWIWLQMNTYVLLNRNFVASKENLARLDAKFPAIVKTEAVEAFRRVGMPFDDFIKKGNRWDIHLQPLQDVHLYSGGISTPFLSSVSDIKYVYIFSAIALFIIVLACVNFMNLSTAQSAARAKEVGIRKVLGSPRAQLIRQFLAEAMLYSAISTMIALFLVALLLPAFNTLSGKALVFTGIFGSGIWLFILALMILTGLLAGSYPAFYLTAFNPVNVLKGGIFKKSFSNLMIRNGLVVFQFTVSIALIICTVVVFQQLRYTQKMDMGLQKDNVIIVPNAEKMNNGSAEALRQQMAQLPGVQNASLTTGTPSGRSFQDTYTPDINGVSEPLAKDVALSSYMADEYFIPSLNLQLLQGRNFSKEYNDSTSVILNESAVKQVGWKNPIGKYIIYGGNHDQRFRVIGVVKDFVTSSIRDTITTFALFHPSSKTYHANAQYMVLKTDGRNTATVISQLEGKWKQMAPELPFEYAFLDKNFENLYQSEQRQGAVFGVFTCFSIIVACLGLFGLSMYTAERRNKEIGIRKVLGASVQSIVGLLSKEFVKLVCIAILLAFPLGWWAMHRWLQDFAYSVKISVWVFVMAGVAAFLIALLTVSSQAIKSALANPVKTLRTE